MYFLFINPTGVTTLNVIYKKINDKVETEFRVLSFTLMQTH